jgi:hypothetical protein
VGSEQRQDPEQAKIFLNQRRERKASSENIFFCCGKEELQNEKKASG